MDVALDESLEDVEELLDSLDDDDVPLEPPFADDDEFEDPPPPLELPPPPLLFPELSIVTTHDLTSST